MSMIEVVARAICRAVHGRWAKSDMLEYIVNTYWRRHIDDACAAIAALRVPTEAMVWAGFDQLGDSTSPHEAEDCWKAMIGAALAEPTTGE